MADGQQQAGGASTTAPTTETESGFTEALKSRLTWDDAKNLDEGKRDALVDLMTVFLENAKAIGTQKMVSEDVRDTIQGLRAEIDRVLSEQVNAILHAPAFQKLESSWRGLKFLVDSAPERDDIKIRVLDVSREELAEAFRANKGERIFSNPLYKQFYSVSLDTYGASPYGCIIADYQFDQSGRDVDVLRGLSQIGAAALAPVVTGASPNLMDQSSWADVARLDDYSSIMNNDEHLDWKDLRESEDARFLAMVLPRTLARRPYGKKGDEVTAFAFEEEIKGSGAENFVWSNAAYALGSRILSSFASSGWGANVVGIETGGTVTGLPTYKYEDERGIKTAICPAEASLTTTQDRSLAAEGLIPLIYKVESAQACFFEAVTVQKPKKYGSDKLTQDAQIAADLPSVLSIARFTQAIKKMALYYVGAAMTAEQLKSKLESYLSRYHNLEPNNDDQAMKAEKPLAAYEVTCEPDPRTAGYFNLKVRLQLLTKVKGVNAAMFFSSKVSKSR